MALATGQEEDRFTAYLNQLLQSDDALRAFLRFVADACELELPTAARSLRARTQVTIGVPTQVEVPWEDIQPQ